MLVRIVGVSAADKTLELPATKANQYGNLESVTLRPSERSVCPVRDFNKFMQSRTSIPALYSPFFCFLDGVYLSCHLFNTTTRKFLSSLPNSHLHESHSFWIGTATTAAANNIPDLAIQTAARWKSQTYRGYIRRGSGYSQINFYETL